MVTLEMVRLALAELLGSSVQRRGRRGEAGYTMQMVVCTALLVAATIVAVGYIAVATTDTAKNIQTR